VSPAPPAEPASAGLSATQGDTGPVTPAPDVLAGASGRVVLTAGARRGLVLLSLLGALLLAASVALALVWAGEKRSRDHLSQARSDAVAAARQEMLDLDSLSAATIDADLAKIIAGATGSFKDQFVKAKTDLKQVVAQRKTTSAGVIRSSGVIRSDNDTATVLIAVDRTIKDASTSQPATTTDRWRLDLEKHDGRWLVASLNPVS
jgi:Mce-associated membrane protein